VIALGAIAVVSAHPIRAQDQPPFAPLPKDCQAPGAAVVADSPLPNVVDALKERKKITILAIGASSIGKRVPTSGGYHALIEAFLERTFKGLDVTIINRGVSGELARDAAERIKTEVALTEPNLVLWQLGTADAMAQVPVDQFTAMVRDTIEWLKAHRVDTVLVGLRYTRSVVKDDHYQAMRAAVAEVAKQSGILRIGRYEAIETIEKIRRAEGNPASDVELGESDYDCMAEYLARAIATSIFAKERSRTRPPPTNKTP
jgi:lysophospholipase L1-like esterase